MVTRPRINFICLSVCLSSLSVFCLPPRLSVRLHFSKSFSSLSMCAEMLNLPTIDRPGINNKIIAAGRWHTDDRELITKQPAQRTQQETYIGARTFGCVHIYRTRIAASRPAARVVVFGLEDIMMPSVAISAMSLLAVATRLESASSFLVPSAASSSIALLVRTMDIARSPPPVPPPARRRSGAASSPAATALNGLFDGWGGGGGDDEAKSSAVAEIPPEVRDEIIKAESNTPAAEGRQRRIVAYFLLAIAGMTVAFFNAFLSDLRFGDGSPSEDLSYYGFGWVQDNFVTSFLFVNTIGGAMALLGAGLAGTLAEVEVREMPVVVIRRSPVSSSSSSSRYIDILYRVFAHT